MRKINKMITALTLLDIATKCVYVDAWRDAVTPQLHATMMRYDLIACYPPRKRGEGWRVSMRPDGLKRLSNEKLRRKLAEAVYKNLDYANFFLQPITK